ncbi:uncharacterized protein LOC129299358 [Prosopis cineraria]|uniref:uncharacterized protein LOC129299358 n=1 Tax=Prosopis cineraria TaxID=364024 RepID=UPI00240F5D8E|nr:uncharacterized protein LOC129299358 [Prosopis cineraria]
MMWRVLENVKKRSRVADESMVVAAEEEEGRGRGRRRRGRHGGGFSVILYCILQVPISILSCVSSPRVNGSAASDGVWVSSGDHFAHISEINHLMVSDSMRYAILM